MRLSVGILAAALAIAAAARAAPWHDRPADLPENPEIRWGVLRNGMRFAILPHETGGGRASLRLVVAAGSLLEREEERGIAHFVEHMAFRGTKEFPKGALVPTLERIGMGLGPDTAAFTTPDATIYQLELPDTTDPTFHLGLRVLREIATEITFEPSAIYVERGVILSEMHLRDTPAYRLEQANTHFLWPHSRAAERAPIGLADRIAHFTRQNFRDFYDAWYRPERMTVVVVGDVSVAHAEALIESTFAAVKGRGAPRAEPPDLYPDFASNPDVQVLRNVGAIGGMVLVEHPYSGKALGFTHALRLQELERDLAMSMFEHRLLHLAQTRNPPFAESRVRDGPAPFGWGNVNLAAVSSLHELARGVSAAEQEQRRVMIYGFTPGELARAKAVVRTGLDQAVETWPTRPPPTLASSIANHLIYGTPLFTPETLRADMEPEIERLTARDCASAFKALWSLAPPHFMVVVPPEVPLARPAVLRVLQASRHVALERPEETSSGDLRYQPAVPGKLARDRFVDDLDVHLSGFENGVELNFKHTAFEANQVEFAVRVGSGWAESPDKVDLRWLAQRAVIAGGLGRQPGAEVQDLLAEHHIQLGFMVAADAQVFHGRCIREELPFALRVVAAYLTDAAFDPNQIGNARATVPYLTGIFRNPPSQYDLQALHAITSYDSRFRVPEAKDLRVASASALKDWLSPILKTGAVETSIVGDVTWADAQAASAATLGAINARPPRPQQPVGDPVKLAAGPTERYFVLKNNAAEAAVTIFWAVPDVATAWQERRCQVIAAILNERIFTRLRQELGETYSPSAHFTRYESPPGLGYYEAMVSVTPQHVRQATKILLDEAAQLTHRHINADTYKRALTPLLRARADEQRSNAYWLFQVLESAQSDSSHLDDARTQTNDYTSLKSSELQSFAANTFRPVNTFTFVAMPPGKVH